MTLRPSAPPARNANLDLLRAAAIVLVFCYHWILMSPVELAEAMRRTGYAQYGVDLFFALSGWLIGTLYWRECAAAGRVALLRFWGRRWLRTVPPYLAALGLAWLAVWMERGQPFDWRYLVFVQNYFPTVPFFVVSWSLCIEEHFYVVLPLVLALLMAGGRRSRAIHLLFLGGIVLAPIGRLIVTADGTLPFAGAVFARTATHLRMEGLLLGFWVAYLPVFEPGPWAALARRSGALLAGSGLLLATVPALSFLWQYRLGMTMLAIGLTGCLVALVNRPAGRIASSPVIRAIAISSYSLYLTHPLMLHVAVSVIHRAPSLPWTLYFPLAALLSAAAGATFYLMIERPAIVLRDRLVARAARPAYGALRLRKAVV